MSRSEGPPDLVIVGSVAFDSIETPWGKVERVLGGSATYASLAASLFCKPAIVGVVGDDFGEAEERLLSGRGVDLSGLERRRGKTFFWHGRYFEDADRRESIVTELGVFADFRPLLPERLRRAPLAFIANINPSLQLSVLSQLEQPRLVACDTMRLWLDTEKEGVLEVLSMADLALVNDEEAHLLTGERSVERMAQRIQALGPKGVVIKRGSAGACVAIDGIWKHIPACPVRDVVDPTGAGDSFAGGLLGYLSRKGETSPEAVVEGAVVASAVASAVVESFGPEGILRLTMDEVRRRVERILETSLLPRPSI